jgi:peptidoglycan/LPS O-acetylase OafA/YrhL
LTLSQTSARDPAGRRLASAAFEPFLEGLRGLAALYVVIHHASLQVYGELSKPAVLLQQVCNFGHYAVAVFIVLSGYCLMLPVIRNPSGTIPGGFTSYILRRARRLLPPYYATLALVLGVMIAFPALNSPAGTRWDDALPVMDSGVIASHLALIHNTSAHWITKIDAPLWSIATEWQIYFGLPAILWLRRRWSAAAATIACFAFGYAIGFGLFALGVHVALEACPWYLGLFALGAAAAGRAAELAGAPNVASLRRRRLLQTLVCLGVALVFSIAESKLQLLARHDIPRRVFVDSLAGLATASFLLKCSHEATRTPRLASWGLIVLEHPLVLRLGSFSYSLYLIHDPIIAWSNRLMFVHGMTNEARFWMLFLVVVPICVALAYAFYLLIERRFVSTRRVSLASA